MPINNFKVLTTFSEISFLSFIFRYIFRITFISNKVFYFSQVNVFIVCHLSRIYLQSEKMGGLIWPKTFDFLFHKHSVFCSEKKRCSLKIAVPEFSSVFIACHFSKIHLQSERKAWLYLAQNFPFFISKTFEFLFRKKRCSLKIAVPEFQNKKK